MCYRLVLAGLMLLRISLVPLMQADQLELAGRMLLAQYGVLNKVMVSDGMPRWKNRHDLAVWQAMSSRMIVWKKTHHDI